MFVIQQLESELIEERQRVDALKMCLEQERERSEMLMVTTASTKEANSNTTTNRDDTVASNLDREWMALKQRRLEAADLEQAQLIRDLHRQRQVNCRMADEIEYLRGQLRTSGAVATSKSCEQIYVKVKVKKTCFPVRCLTCPWLLLRTWRPSWTRPASERWRWRTRSRRPRY